MEILVTFVLFLICSIMSIDLHENLAKGFWNKFLNFNSFWRESCWTDRLKFILYVFSMFFLFIVLSTIHIKVTH